MSFVVVCACGCGKRERQRTHREHGWFTLTQDFVNCRTENKPIGVLRFANLQCLSSWLEKKLGVKMEKGGDVLEPQVSVSN